MIGNQRCSKYLRISLDCSKQGGLKAAITADAIQGMVLIFVSVLIGIQGAYETGSVKDVYNINKENGKFFMNISVMNTFMFSPFSSRST